MKMVWLLWESDGKTPWILEAVYADKVKAEADLRYLEETDNGRGYMYWIQEKEVK